MSSKVVYIKRKRTTDMLPGTKDQDSIMKIGSSLKGQSPLSGLSFDDERKYLPSILGIDPKSEQWNKVVKDYWSNISAVVPKGDVGLKLEIGLDDNKEPINVHDWILYQYCLVYGRVANSIKDVNISPKIRFYIYSQDEEVDTKYELLKIRKKAFKEYLKLLESENKMDMVLRLFNIDADKLKLKQKEIALSKYSTEEESIYKFVSITTDKSLEMKGFIEDCIFKQKLKRIPNTQTIMFEDEVIGNTMQEAVGYFNSRKNTGLLNQLRASLDYLSNKNIRKIEEVEKVEKVEEVEEMQQDAKDTGK